MTNFEAVVKNNPQFVKEVIASYVSLGELKRSLTGELKHKNFYTRRKDGYEMDFLNAEYIKPVLDDIEKKYLSDIIRPFRHNVKNIRKAVCSGKYFIEINMKEACDRVWLPYFAKNSEMYSGMKENKSYSLDELGL